MYIPNPTARIGEEAACKLLRKKGYKILDRNFRKGYGEIDIVATLKNKLLVFVEVKTKTSDVFGTPFDAITSSKLKTLIKTCELYKSLTPKVPDEMRIDAVSVYVEDRKVKEIEHIENITGF